MPFPSSVLIVQFHPRQKYKNGTTLVDHAPLATFVLTGNRGICAMYKRYAGFKGWNESLFPVLEEILQAHPRVASHCLRLVPDELVGVPITQSSA